MQNNQITLELGGQKRTITFNFRTLKEFRDITGADPFYYKFETTTFENTLKAVIVITYAGLLSRYKSENRTVDFTQDDASNWVLDLSFMEAHDIVHGFIDAYSLKTVPPEVATGEVGNDTQQAADLG